ncbi:MAG: hypothetical protein A2156_12030 [Deltaproteobacteria bacterium RBG_16_48_10]|nr:MAG: hypothetical protein A2156_12030 [Deltaproteobacteria bacterium RBG_16_48_10]
MEVRGKPSRSHPHPYPFPCLRRSGFVQAGASGRGGHIIFMVRGCSPGMGHYREIIDRGINKQ